jgi:hypothetical protein
MLNQANSSDDKRLAHQRGMKRLCAKRIHKECPTRICYPVENHNCNLVLHIHPTTFLGDGLLGPLSRCPEVKYSQPSQYPTKVVLIRKGNRPITLHSCMQMEFQ